MALEAVPEPVVRVVGGGDRAGAPGHRCSGSLVFKRRIRGPYFAILTQAMALVFWLLLVGQLQLTAGTNGLTNFSKTFGRNKFDPDTPEFLYRLALVGAARGASPSAGS